MAITNRQELEAAIADWLNREDDAVKSRIPDFITLAENRIFRRLRCRHNEGVLQVPNIGAVNFVFQVPSDLLEVKAMALAGRTLIPRSDQKYLGRSDENKTGETRYYTRLKTSIDQYYLWPTQDGLASQVDLYYYEKQILGTNDSDNTQVLTEAPELYLFGALLEAVPFLKFPDFLPVWQQKYDEVFAFLMEETWTSEYAGATVSVSSVYGDGDVY